MELWRAVAHSHWLTIRFLSREVRVCARCSGYLTGFLSFFALRNLSGLSFLAFGVHGQLLVSLLCVAPLAYDWLTQSWGWRDSTNKLRFITGAILGFGFMVLYSSDAASLPKALTVISIASAVVFLGIVGRSLGKRRSLA